MPFHAAPPSLSCFYNQLTALCYHLNSTSPQTVLGNISLFSHRPFYAHTNRASEPSQPVSAVRAVKKVSPCLAEICLLIDYKTAFSRVRHLLTVSRKKMNENIVRNILTVVKTSSDKEVVFKALVKLRTDLVKDREGIVLFRECGGIPPVVRLLNKPYEKILEVALSILGNCCTDSQCCSQALENKILPPLLTILKSVPNTVVLCRACRLLGNLAKDNNSQLMGHSAALSQALCLILEESDVLTTTVMAVRAAKFLLIEKQFLKCFVVHHGFQILLTVFLKLVKNPINLKEAEGGTDRPAGRKSSQPREEYFKEVARHLEGVRSDIFDMTMDSKTGPSNQYMVPTDKAAMDLVSEILKCFQIISAAQFFGLVMEVYSTEQGIAGIVFFADEKNPLRSMALKIISNFAKNPLSVAVMGAANAVSAACDLLTAENLNTPLTESENRYCINIICSLAGDACNRSKIRRSGALVKLLQKARMTKSCSETALILYALNHFQYDQMSMHLLLREGLVGILINELDSYLNSSDKQRQDKVQEKKRITRKRKLEQNPPKSFKLGTGFAERMCSEGAFLQHPKAWADLFEPDSPGSPKAIMSPGSPCSSRSMSPVSTCSKNFYDVECEADNYSPVCSGDEDESSDEHKAKEEDSDVMKLLAIASQPESNSDETMLDKEEDDDGNQDLAYYRVPNGNTNAIDIIDNLLLRVSLLGEHHGELGHPQTIKTIIQAINTFGTQGNTFGSTLTNILSEIQFFVPIVKQDVVHRLHLMTKIEDLQAAATTFLERLTCVAESGYGRGELARLLTRCELNVQKRAAIAVSFIIRTPKFLHRLLTENGAIYILMNMMLDKNDKFSQEAADGLTALSTALGIEKSNWDQGSCEEEFDESTEFPVSYQDGGVEVKFVLHRGCSKIPIKFNKKLLTENSEVFNSMLNSSFKEGNEGEIHLTNYSVHGIKYFLHCIKLMSEKKRLTFPPVYHFDSLLESYELSRIYIMNDLEQNLFEMIVNRLSPKACLKVFEWCLKNLNQDLSELAINYYLCGPVQADVRVSMFREADYSSVSKEWNQMIVDTILVRCQNRMCDPPLVAPIGM